MTKPSRKTNAGVLETTATATLVPLQMVPRFIIARSGLKYLEGNPADLERLVRARMSDLLFTNETEYLTFLQDGEKGKKEFELLAKELTVGETYFFRHREQFEAIKAFIPDLLNRKGGRELRLWSAACSNGAELYSLAILLKENFSEQWGEKAPYLVGTDINSDSLAKASAGIYEEWSLRGVTDFERNKYFELDGKTRRVRDEYRAGVQFHFHNLASDPIPAPEQNLYGFDIIFLRNLLIYFDPKLLSEFLSKVCDALVPGGYLAVAPAEVGPDFQKWFEPISFPGGLLYRKPLDLSTLGKRPEKKKKSLLPLTKKGVPVAPPPADDTTADLTLETAMSGANSGKLHESKHLLERLIKKDSMNFEAHHYLGLVNYNLGNTTEAETNFRRVLYLRRDFFPALFHLAMIYRKVGDQAESHKILETVETRLARKEPHEMLYSREGLRVEDALTMVRFALQTTQKK